MSLYRRTAGRHAAYAILARIRREQPLERLHSIVLANYKDELRKADGRQFEHLAQRAEARYSTNLGERMRALVDAERARRGGGSRRLVHPGFLITLARSRHAHSGGAR